MDSSLIPICTPFKGYIETQGEKEKTSCCSFTCSDERLVVMELIDPSKSCSSRDEEVEAIELLDEFWFFKNLLHGGVRMFRSSFDPYPSSNKIQVIVADVKQSSTSTNLPTDNGFVRHNFHRTPSLPPHVGREKMVRDKEIVRRSSKLTKQASLNSSDIFLMPPLSISKTMTPSPSIPRHRTRRESKMESATKDIRDHPWTTKESIYGNSSQKKISKSLSELEFEEVQGFKDLGFVFDKDTLNPSVVNIIPGLQSKSIDRENDKVSRPYLSEAWLVQRSFPQIPYWIDQISDVGDKKAQLKFWARAVASNVRQEC